MVVASIRKHHLLLLHFLMDLILLNSGAELFGERGKTGRDEP